MRDSAVILLAEDLEDDVLLIRRAFTKAGVQNPLFVVHDGEEAIQYLQGEGKFANRAEYPLPDLTLLDLKMPRKDGFEVLEWVRQQPTLRGLRIVVLTSSKEIRDVDRAYQLGANSVLVKPAEFTNLVEISQFLGGFLRLSQTPRTARVSGRDRSSFQSTFARQLEPCAEGDLLVPPDARYKTQQAFLRALIAYDRSERGHHLRECLAKAEREDRCLRRGVALMLILFLLSCTGLAYCAALTPDIFDTRTNPTHAVLQGLCFMALAAGISQAAFLAYMLRHRVIVARLHLECRRLVLALVEARMKQSPQLESIPRHQTTESPASA
jgi:CheY-like chemotaxis protein